jgi:hypothetical protein
MTTGRINQITTVQPRERQGSQGPSGRGVAPPQPAGCYRSSTRGCAPRDRTAQGAASGLQGHLPFSHSCFPGPTPGALGAPGAVPRRRARPAGTSLIASSAGGTRPLLFWIAMARGQASTEPIRQRAAATAARQERGYPGGGSRRDPAPSGPWCATAESHPLSRNLILQKMFSRSEE